LTASDANAAVAAPPAPYVKRNAPPECKMGSNGRQACGFNCRIGADGVAACADAPDGNCTAGADGHVTCTQIAARGGSNAGGAVPECEAGTDSISVCGYNCKQGTNER